MWKDIIKKIVSFDDIVLIDKLSVVGETYVVEWIYYNKSNIGMGNIMAQYILSSMKGKFLGNLRLLGLYSWRWHYIIQ